jgi:hypothetical protein
MKKALILCVTLLFLMGCKVDYIAEINADLSGKSTATIITFGMITKQQLEAEMIKRGITNYTITDFVENVEITPGHKEPVPGLKIDTSWKTIDEFIRTFSIIRGGVNDPFVKNPDGTITVNLGKVTETGSTTIKTEGQIVSATDGAHIDGNTAVFTPAQKVRLTFKPQTGLPMLPIAGGTAVLCLIGVTILFLNKKKPTTTLNAVEAGETPEPKCAKCGETLEKGAGFCINCGTKIA